MRELDAQKVVAVRVLEEADPDGSLIPAAWRSFNAPPKAAKLQATPAA